MNNPVSPETAKLLKAKGYHGNTCAAYVDTTPFDNKTDELTYYKYPQDHNRKEHRASAPTIAEVAMWFYEKHNYWIEVQCPDEIRGKWSYRIRTPFTFHVLHSNDNCSSPTSAYEEAFHYLLNLTT